MILQHIQIWNKINPVPCTRSVQKIIEHFELSGNVATMQRFFACMFRHLGLFLFCSIIKRWTNFFAIRYMFNFSLKMFWNNLIEVSTSSATYLTVWPTRSLIFLTCVSSVEVESLLDRGSFSIDWQPLLNQINYLESCITSKRCFKSWDVSVKFSSVLHKISRLNGCFRKSHMQ